MFVVVHQVQSQIYPLNQNNDCTISSDAGSGAVYYYSPSDLDDVGVYVASHGSCSVGSYTHVTVTAPSGAVYDCGYAPLDGTQTLLSCTNYPRGTAEEGGNFFTFDLGITLAQVALTFTHEAETRTAPTPTSTVVTTPSKFQLTSIFQRAPSW